jgi:hypothetical protein
MPCAGRGAAPKRIARQALFAAQISAGDRDYNQADSAGNQHHQEGEVTVEEYFSDTQHSPERDGSAGAAGLRGHDVQAGGLLITDLEYGPRPAP